MYGDGKSDRLIVAEKRANKDCGVPQLAEYVEPSSLTKGNSFQQNKFRTQCRYGSIWTTLNGHEARNRGHCQEIVPTSHPQTCKVRWNGYGRRSVCASTPEVGAQCGSSARWDLRGGRRVTGVPTATVQDGRFRLWPLPNGTRNPQRALAVQVAAKLSLFLVRGESCTER